MRSHQHGGGRKAADQAGNGIVPPVARAVRSVVMLPRRSDNCQTGERAGRVKTAQRRRVVLTRPSAPGRCHIGTTRQKKSGALA
jgi:hypothetical protein